MSPNARLIAFYLPQFHPIPENDEWWGKGFTEWTNVAKAKPLFKGHYQPRLPADLGFYDLRVPEVREAQAELARNAGIEGFCYYHYWFGGGKRLLERPFNEVVASGKPDFPFCLCWANQTWSGIWHGEPGRTLMEQTYPGPEDHREHFFSLLNAFLDKRYVRINGRPIFMIFRPAELPDVSAFIQQWQGLAVENGLPSLHFIAHMFSEDPAWDYKAAGFDSCVVEGARRAFAIRARDLFLGVGSNGSGHRRVATRDTTASRFREWLWRRSRATLGQFSNVRLYSHAFPFMLQGCSDKPGVFPCVIPNWDNTPRSGTRGWVLHESTPELFGMHLREALTLVRSRAPDERLVFIKAWNEWAEGNYLEPDRKFGNDYLRVVREEVGTVEIKMESPTGIYAHKIG